MRVLQCDICKKLLGPEDTERSLEFSKVEGKYQHVPELALDVCPECHHKIWALIEELKNDNCETDD